MSRSVYTRFCLIPALALGIAACASNAPHSIKPSDEEIARIQSLSAEAAIAELEESLAQLRTSQDLNFFAPAHYELASKSLNDARQRLQANAPREQVTQKVATAEAVLRNGQRVAKQVKVLLEDEINMKQKLDELNTNQLYASEYSNLLERMSQVIRNIENGKKGDAQTLRPKLIADMQELEIRAVRHEALHDADEIMRRVTNSGGEELIPNTYKDAMAVMKRAEEFILANADDRANVKKVADEALFAARRALTIVDEVAALSHKTKRSLEQVVLDEEYRLYRIARRLGIQDPRAQPLEVQSELIGKAAADVIEDRGYHEQMNDILREAVVRQAEINNEPALMEEIKNLKRERSELLAKEALYSAKLAELRGKLESTQQRAITAEQRLSAISTTAQPSIAATPPAASAPTDARPEEKQSGALGAFANSEL